MTLRNLYASIAIALPIALGLGLIYLYGVGRIGALTAIASMVGMGVLIVSPAILANVAEEEPRRRRSSPVVRL